jgi:hypothetical protein
MQAEGRISTRDWDLYDTRHVVYRPARLTPQALKAGYDWAYREFYRWPSIARGALAHGSVKHQAKHFFYAAGWKKFERLWDAVITLRQLPSMTPVLEAVLSKISRASETMSFDEPVREPATREAAGARVIPLRQTAAMECRG